MSDELQRQAKEVLASSMVAIMKDELLTKAETVLSVIECEDCGHSLGLHFSRYGCEADMGDREGDEDGPAYARGECGCKAENLSDDGTEAFLLLRDLRQLRILASMK